MSDIDIAPTIIREVIYPHNMPSNVIMLVESAMISHNTSNFMGGVQNLEKAKVEWIKILNGDDLTEETNIFFEFSKGLIYESANRDDFAFNSFYQCKLVADRLPDDSADRALAFCGLGAILYKTHDYKWALRCFLKAREIRETYIGPDSIDTATVYNNLGCCMYMLQRINEAYSFFELSHAILEDGLGPFHFRTGTALRNLGKSKKATFQTTAPYSTLWQAYVVDSFPGKGKKKKKKKGK